MKSDVVIPAALLAGDGEVRFLRALVEHSTDMVSIIGADGSLMFHYPPALLGYGEGENVGESVFDFIHPDDLPAALEHFASALATPGLGDPFECRILGADGAWHWIELIGTNLLDDPVIEGVVVNGRDITERRDAEEALRKSGARFKALVQHASELMLVWDASGVITYASPATLRFAMGQVPDDPDDDVQHITMYMAPEDRDRVTKLVVELSARPAASERFVAKFRRHDGEYRSLEVIVTNLLDDPNIHGIVANSRDITDQLEFQEALGQSEEWFRSLVQHGSDIVAVLDADGRALREPLDPARSWVRPGVADRRRRLRVRAPRRPEPVGQALRRGARLAWSSRRGRDACSPRRRYVALARGRVHEPARQSSRRRCRAELP